MKRNLQSLGLFFFVLLLSGGLLAQQASSSRHGAPADSASNKHPVLFSHEVQSSKAVAARQEPPDTETTAKPQSLARLPKRSSLISDAERTALTYDAYNLEVHLEPPQHSLAVQVDLTARNSSDKPLSKIALQLSSSLHWYSIQIHGRPVTFQTELIDSDIDHTGRLTEAVISLEKPLPPAATIQIHAIYSGVVEQSSERLLRLGAPAKAAASSEWDAIDVGFSALRGFGNVIWFPVSTAPVLFGQGAEMFDSIGKWKLRESNAKISMRVLVEYLDVQPTVAFLNGYVVQPEGSKSPSAATSATASPRKNHSPESEHTSIPAPETVAGNKILQVASFILPPTRLGFSPLSLFVMHAAYEHIPGLNIYSRAGNQAAAATYQRQFQQTRPLIEQWLGSHAIRPVVLVDLPNANDLPLEQRNLLFLPLQRDAHADSVDPAMAHMLGHAYFSSPRVWLNEGVPQFMTLLWIEQHAGRATAIAQMESRRDALILSETTDPGVTPGQSLIDAWSDIYYRDKAANVLWMIRDIVGERTLSAALRAYSPAEAQEADYLQSLLQKSSSQNLDWFFKDWVYRDRGLPDLHILSAYFHQMQQKGGTGTNYLVSIQVQNTSFCAAEVPVTIESASSSQTKSLLVPSHATAVLRVLTDSHPEQVLVNDGSVPEAGDSRHVRAIIATP